MALFFDGVHLMSDESLEELHAFAIGTLCLQESWFQESPPASFPHYDVFGYKKRKLKSHFSDQITITNDRGIIVDVMSRFRVANGF